MKLSKNIFISFFFLLLLTFNKVCADDVYPKRVISLSPSITEIIYGIGAFDKVVGVTLYSDYPQEAKELPKVGGWINPNLEALLELEPDLVIMISDQNKIFGEKINEIGLKTLSVDSNTSIKHIQNSIIEIGKFLGKQEEAAELVAKIRIEISKIKNKTHSLEPKKILCVIGRTPGSLNDIYVIGNTNYINEMINLSGGINVIEKDRLAIKITKEAIFSLDPDIIIEINHAKTDRESEIKEIWSELKEARAIKTNNVYIISSTAILHPSQRILEGIYELLRIIHPEAYSSS